MSSQKRNWKTVTTSATWPRASLLAVSLPLALNTHLVFAAPQTAPQWPEMARADLQAIHQIILDGHPGVIDEQNPGFKDWMEQGYQAAQAMTPRVTNDDDFMAVLRWYVSGFQDGHLAVYNDVA